MIAVVSESLLYSERQLHAQLIYQLLYNVLEMKWRNRKYPEIQLNSKKQLIKISTLWKLLTTTVLGYVYMKTILCENANIVLRLLGPFIWKRKKYYGKPKPIRVADTLRIVFARYSCK